MISRISAMDGERWLLSGPRDGPYRYARELKGPRAQMDTKGYVTSRLNISTLCLLAGMLCYTAYRSARTL
eukprot:1742594-Pyramimonas_sp.AAC.1